MSKSDDVKILCWVFNSTHYMYMAENVVIFKLIIMLIISADLFTLINKPDSSWCTMSGCRMLAHITQIQPE